MKVTQYVMAYSAEQDRLRAILPEGFISLRPVLRINAEILDGRTAYLEFNTAVEKDGVRGWINIGCFENVAFLQAGNTTTFTSEHLEISFTAVGIQGGCPAEKDNAGCFFGHTLRPSEIITANKEFCDCHFCWLFGSGGAHGKSIGKTLPAIPTAPVTVYPKLAFSVENAATIPCQQVLGSYKVEFERLQ